MLETIAAKTDIDIRGMNFGGWDAQEGRGYRSYSIPQTPIGISQARVFITPTGSTFRMEGNLTSLLHGAYNSSGSLHPEEVALATAVFLTQAGLLVGSHVSLFPELWQYVRWDASLTYLLPYWVRTGLLCRAASDKFAESVKGRQVATRYVSNGVTAGHTLSRSKMRRVYESAPAAHSAGKREIRNALRVETQFRPVGKQVRYLDETGAVVTMAKQEMTEMAALLDQLAHLSAQSCQATAGALIAGQVALGEKADPREALKLAGIAQIISMEGIAGCVSLGVPRATVYRWNARIKALLQGVGEEGWMTAQESLFGPEAVVYARDLVEQTEGAN